VKSGKGLKVVIQRGNIKITVKDVRKLKEILKEQGLTDFQVIVSGNLDNEVKILNLIDKFNIKTNLKDGTLGTDITLEVSVDKSNEGKELYCYYIDGNGKFVLVGKGKVESSLFAFVTNHFSDYIIVDREITNKDNTDVENEDDDNLGSKGNDDGSTSGNNTSDTTKTNDNIGGSEVMILICMLFVSFAGISYFSKKKKA
jgi:hypothetical protein